MWLKGIWNDGTWNKGLFNGGIWVHGTWNSGTFNTDSEPSYWLDGEWYGGDFEQLKANFKEIGESFNMQATFYDQSKPVKVLIMVSKFDHCLLNLLYRYHKGELDFEITAIVSNHLDLRSVAEREGIRFIYLPVTKDNKSQQEQELIKIVDETGTELVILARYMQILSNNLCKQLSGRAINIHHSFLPGFKGAKPYHQVRLS